MLELQRIDHFDYIDPRPPPRRRWACPYCKKMGWWEPSVHTGPKPLYDHNKPDGTRCHKAVAAGKRESQRNR